MGIGISKCDTPYYAKQARFDREECEISSSDYLGKVTMSAIEHFIQGLLLFVLYKNCSLLVYSRIAVNCLIQGLQLMVFTRITINCFIQGLQLIVLYKNCN